MLKTLGIKKLYYSISEVSKITDVEQYVLRYWETEFEQLQPQKNRAGNRIYTNNDVKLVLMIKKLLRDERYTIEGAKKVLEEMPRPSGEQLDLIDPKTEREKLRSDLKEVKKFLEDLLTRLE